MVFNYFNELDDERPFKTKVVLYFSSKSVPFCAIQAATNHNVRFLLKHRNDLGGVECASLKLETYQASIALYRSITEKHAFYSCETVRSAVTSQFVRDLKGTIASFFNENTDLGKQCTLFSRLFRN